MAFIILIISVTTVFVYLDKGGFIENLLPQIITYHLLQVYDRCIF